MYIDIAGAGPGLLLVHGSAADADTWRGQRRALRDRFRLILYDRRGTPRSPLPPGDGSYSVARHADDAAALIASQQPPVAPVIACGSSFGAVCVLELARRHPHLVRGVVLCEPPLPPPGQASGLIDTVRGELHRLRREQGGEAAAAHFLRLVLGDSGLARLPAAVRARCVGLHQQILLDCDALHAYQTDYASLQALAVPALLLGGDRSPPYFRAALEALRAALPCAELRILAGASHIMHADAFERFNRALLRFAEQALARKA